MTIPLPPAPPFSMLLRVGGADDQATVWSESATIEGWLAFERALALAQSREGEMPADHAAAIASAATAPVIDRDELWATARNVGYPILGLVRQIGRALPSGPAGRVHFGATTQDVMDTGLALQLARSLTLLDQAICTLGDAIAFQVEEHRDTVMAARTHAQQAVPTTFGATLATLLAQLTRHRLRIASARPRVALVSLYGAGGTSAALGPGAAKVRMHVAEQLGLGVSDVPWHVERDGPAEFGWLCATTAGACAKLARNVIDLSRTEIAEVHERFSEHRGASSTMPQKVNPISAEIIVGLAVSAGALTSALTRMQEAGHERSAGEWQVEWHVLPQLAVLAGSALTQAADLVTGLRVDAERMRTNLGHEGGLVMAEAMMIRLADSLGQAGAHDLVYAAAQRARSDGLLLADAARLVAHDRGLELPASTPSPTDYLGDAHEVCHVALRSWRDLPTAPITEPPIQTLAQR